MGFSRQKSAKVHSSIRICQSGWRYPFGHPITDAWLATTGRGGPSVNLTLECIADIRLRESVLPSLKAGKTACFGEPSVARLVVVKRPGQEFWLSAFTCPSPFRSLFTLIKNQRPQKIRQEVPFTDTWLVCINIWIDV